jgi:hypothetical protein
LPNTSAGFDQHEWCGPMEALRLPCFARGDCNVSSGDGEGVSFYWNYSNPITTPWRVADNLAFGRQLKAAGNVLVAPTQQLRDAETLGWCRWRCQRCA